MVGRWAARCRALGGTKPTGRTDANQSIKSANHRPPNRGGTEIDGRAAGVTSTIRRRRACLGIAEADDDGRGGDFQDASARHRYAVEDGDGDPSASSAGSRRSRSPPISAASGRSPMSRRMWSRVAPSYLHRHILHCRRRRCSLPLPHSRNNAMAAVGN
jgi:hypothetical protein